MLNPIFKYIATLHLNFTYYGSKECEVLIFILLTNLKKLNITRCSMTISAVYYNFIIALSFFNNFSIPVVQLNSPALV